MTKLSNNNEYQSLITNIGNILEQGKKQAYQKLNNIVVMTYWEIGKYIVKYEQKGEDKAGYGAQLLKFLSTDLTNNFGKGFSVDSLERMRKLYQLFPKSATLSRKLSWSHYRLIIRLKEPLARNFYILETEKENWSTRELDRQINAMLFERLALSKDKAKVLKLSEKGQVIENPQDILKDPYVLEFLGLQEQSHYSETELEQKIIDNLEKFLLELGKGFMFVERQKRITLEDDHFYIDLVFYNRFLKCFLIIELKIGKLTHKDLGQLQMYVNYFDREIKNEDENPTIRLLLCADKKKSIVEYTLP